VQFPAATTVQFPTGFDNPRDGTPPSVGYALRSGVPNVGTCGDITAASALFRRLKQQGEVTLCVTL